jgi:hypothetical protein
MQVIFVLCKVIPFKHRHVGLMLSNALHWATGNSPSIRSLLFHGVVCGYIGFRPLKCIAKDAESIINAGGLCADAVTGRVEKRIGNAILSGAARWSSSGLEGKWSKV